MAAARSSFVRPSLAVFAIAFAVYAITAARTITFWDGSHYALLARTLSISNPPGSLLLTLIGRFLGDLPFAWPMAFRLNLLAAMVGAAVAALVAVLGARLTGATLPRAATITGAVVAGLLFAFGPTPWFHSTQFNPYGLSAFSTGLILLAFLSWWERAAESDAPARAALVALLFGLDFSVHRANVLLVPAVITGVLLRRPRVAVSPRFLGATAGAFLLGAAFQLLYIPLSLREPFLDISVPSSLESLWHFERMDVVGGGFLVDVWPRRADFLHVQLADLGHFIRANFGAPWAWIAGAALAVAGFAVLVRRAPRLGIAWILLALATGLGEVVYFNRPAEYFRPLDRHYLPFLVTVAPLVATGVAAIVAGVRGLAGRPEALAAGAIAFALPASAALANFRDHDFSRTNLAERFGRDLLEPLPRGAVLFTNGDNDSFPLWYLQQVEHVRTDVDVVNLSTIFAPGGLHRARRLPGLENLAISESLVTDIVRRSVLRRPTFLAVTVSLPAPIPGISERLRVAGLAQRAAMTPADTAVSRADLEAFVRERLPRTGLNDSRQIVPTDLQLLAGNYVAVTLQLVERQLAERDGLAAMRTLDVLDVSFPVWRYPVNASAVRDWEAGLRQRASALYQSGATPRR